METGGPIPAGSGRSLLRLDPFALPVRFPAHDAGADGELRQVELDRERVVMRRTVRGIPMSVAIPVHDFRGLTLRLVSFGDGGPRAVAIVLDHRDPALSLPIHVAEDGEDLVVICKAWSRVLRLPVFTEAYRRPGKRVVRVGKVLAQDPKIRRRGRAALRQRRPSIRLRRKSGGASDQTIVHRDEREIIARN